MAVYRRVSAFLSNLTNDPEIDDLPCPIYIDRCLGIWLDLFQLNGLFQSCVHDVRNILILFSLHIRFQHLFHCRPVRQLRVTGHGAKVFDVSFWEESGL
jgi:hypothetical protein